MATSVKSFETLTAGTTEGTMFRLKKSQSYTYTVVGTLDSGCVIRLLRSKTSGANWEDILATYAAGVLNSSATYTPEEDCAVMFTCAIADGSTLTGPVACTVADVAGEAVDVQIGVPAAFTTRSLANTDNGKNLICGSAQVATVPTGLASGFGCAFKGIITFTAPGTGVATVTDVRTTGATNPWCALVQTGTDTYDCVGTKA